MFMTLFFLSRLFFFDDEPDNDGSGSRSYGTCYFLYSSENSVGSVNSSKSVGHLSSSKYVGRVSGIYSVVSVRGILKVGRIG